MSDIRVMASLPVYLVASICEWLSIGPVWLAEKIEGDF